MQEQGRLVDLSQQQHRLKAKKDKKKESQSVRGRSRSSAGGTGRGGSVIGDGDDHLMDEDDNNNNNNEEEEKDVMEEGDGIAEAAELGDLLTTKQQHNETLTFTVPGYPDYVQSGNTNPV